IRRQINIDRQPDAVAHRDVTRAGPAGGRIGGRAPREVVLRRHPPAAIVPRKIRHSIPPVLVTLQILEGRLMLSPASFPPQEERQHTSSGVASPSHPDRAPRVLSSALRAARYSPVSFGKTR